MWLLVVLVEKSRGEDNQIHLSNTDMMSLTGKPGSGLTNLASASATSSSLAASSSSTVTSTSAASGSQCNTLLFSNNFSILCRAGSNMGA